MAKGCRSLRSVGSERRIMARAGFYESRTPPNRRMHATRDTKDFIFGWVAGGRVMRGVMRRYRARHELGHEGRVVETRSRRVRVTAGDGRRLTSACTRPATRGLVRLAHRSGGRVMPALDASSRYTHIRAAIMSLMSTELSDILQMSVAERIQLVEDIWDSLAASPESIPVTDAQKAELDRRLQAHAQNPDEGIPWDELKEKVRKSA